MFEALLMGVKMMMTVADGVFKNACIKGELKTKGDNAMFNMLACLIGVVPLIFTGGLNPISGFTFGLSVAYGFLITCTAIVYMEAYRNGPLGLTTLIASSGMFIPTLFGVLVWKETMTLWQILGLALVFVSMVLILNPKKNTRITGLWIVLALCCCLINGSTSVCQQLLAHSVYAAEDQGFLFYGFLFSTLMLLACMGVFHWSGKERITTTLFGKVGVISLTVGTAGIISHIINMYLVTKVPGSILYPVMSGGSIILVALSDAVFFRERMTRRQLAGFAVGLAAILLLANVAELF